MDIMNSTFSNCQIFTPAKFASELLDAVDYTENLFGKKVLENTCGAGAILKEIVRRYIKNACASGYSNLEIIAGLESDIVGVEIDDEHIRTCRNELDEVANEFFSHSVNWSIINADALKYEYQHDFDYVVGNPPYITYRKLDYNTRTFVKENFATCNQGKFDYCYAFIELGINLLKNNGILGYIVPSNIFKNVFGQSLRDFLLPHVIKIQEHKNIKLFPGKLTSSSFLVCRKNGEENSIDYYDAANSQQRQINKSKLVSKWQFIDSQSNIKQDISHLRKFGEFYKPRISIATQFNKAFIIKDHYMDLGTYLKVGEYYIEKNILRPAGSPRGMSLGKKEYIIFPYQLIDGQIYRWSEKDFKVNFPGTFNYLSQFKGELLARDAEKGVSWFEYGRSQSLSHINRRKLLLSTVVTDRVRVYELGDDWVPYSGIYLTMENELSLEIAVKILRSNEFLKYVESIGTHINGSSIRITPSDIEKYIFSLFEVSNGKITI